MSSSKGDVGPTPTPGTVKNPLSLSSTALKLIACGAMLIDHIGFVFFPEQLLWRIVGRISFPIFAFLVAEGYERTSNVRAYGMRLLGFAALSQIPYMLFRYAADGGINDLNIFFTLAVGLFLMGIWEKLPLASSIPATLIIAGLAQYLSFDYGAYGVLTVLVSRIVLHHKRAGIASLLLLPQIPVLIRFGLGVISIQTFAAMSVPLIAAYNGQRGAHLHRYFFYAFYPVHLLILFGLWFVLSRF